MPVKFVNFLKSKLIFNTSYCFWMFVNKLFTYADISKSKRCFIAEFSTYYFHMKAKMGDFHQNDVNHSILVSLLLISNRIYTLQQSLFQNCNNKRWPNPEQFVSYRWDFYWIRHRLYNLIPSLNKELVKSYPWKLKKSQ